MPTLHQLHQGARRTKTFRTKTPAFRNKANQISPQKRGFIIRLDISSPKKPNSAKRKTAKVQLMDGKTLIAYIPGQGNNLQKLAQVLVRGGRCQDVPGVRYHIFRQKEDFQMSELFDRKYRRSKYGKIKPRPTE